MNHRPSPAEAAAWRQLRVLVVDDVEPMRTVLRALLGQLGIQQVAEAGSGEAALALLAAQPADLVICDWRMPGLDGLGLLRALREQAGDRPPLPFVLMSAESDPQALAQAREAGVDELLTKPFDPATLAASLRQALQARAPSVVELPDLRSPLASALGLLEPLLQDDGLDGERHAALQGVEQALLESLDLLQLSVELPRLEHGQAKLQTRGVPIRKLAERARRLLLSSQAHRQLQLELQLPGPLRGPQALLASGDPLLCHTLLARLFDAAFALLPDGSKLSLQVQLADERLELLIELPLALGAAQRSHFFAAGSAAHAARRLAQAQRGELVLQVDEASGRSLLRLQLLRSQLTMAAG